MKKQLTALLTAAALAFGAAPITTFAEAGVPGSGLPGWVPRDYVSAVEFYNTHGKTYSEDGFLCFITPRYRIGDQPELKIVSSEEPAYTFTPPVVLSSKNNLLDDNDLFSRNTEPLYDLTVSVFKPKAGSELTISLIQDNCTAPLHTYTFDVLESGVNETDLYSWVPDCVGEYEAFNKANPTFSLHDGYIVYCDDLCIDGGYGLELNQIGTGAVEQAARYSCSSLYTFEMPCGDSARPFILYRPTKPGTVKMTAMEVRPWAWGKEPPVQCDEVYYTIDNDLNIKEADGIAAGEAQAGDLNSDGKLDTLDIIALHKYLYNHGTLENPELADLDHDGSVDVFDLALLQRAVLLQSPWEDKELQFTGEVCKLNVSAPERYKEFNVRYCSNLKNLKLDASYWDEGAKERVSIEPKTITDETFKDYTVLLVTSPTTSGSVTMTPKKVERKGSRLIIHVEREYPLNPTPDEAVNYAILVLDKDVFDGISEFAVEENQIHEAQTAE